MKDRSFVKQIMCLLIGATGVGKTLLLKRLNTCSHRGSYVDVGEAPATIATVGTNLMNVVIGRKQEVTVRELGGCMAPIWKNYYSNCSTVMFVIDMANRMQVSASCILLLETITNDSLQQSKLLVILNKMDVSNAMKKSELDSMIRLNDIMRHAKQEITILEVSAKDGQGLQDIVKWIQNHSKR